MNRHKLNGSHKDNEMTDEKKSSHILLNARIFFHVKNKEAAVINEREDSSGLPTRHLILSPVQCPVLYRL